MLYDQINVVIHVAATVKFNESLEVAFNLNVNGTHQLLLLSRKMKHLLCFCHISTGYYCPSNTYIDETVKDFSLCLKWNDMDRSLNLEDDIKAELYKHIGPDKCYPNTYTITKHIAEILVKNASNTLPCVIIRPSIISAAMKEPFPGWLDSFNGPAGDNCSDDIFTTI